MVVVRSRIKLFAENLRSNKLLASVAFIFLIVWGWTLFGARDTTDWMLENIPVLFVVSLLVLTHKKYPLSNFSYIILFLYISLHLYGAKHIYAENPLGLWLKEIFHTRRNNYDRIIHFIFGLTLANPLYEVFFRYFKFGKLLSLIFPVVFCLALGAFYEILEWVITDFFFPEQGTNFLGSQGDIWDAQKDMILGTLGAAATVIFIYLISKVKELKPSINLYIPRTIQHSFNLKS